MKTNLRRSQVFAIFAVVASASSFAIGPAVQPRSAQQLSPAPRCFTPCEQVEHVLAYDGITALTCDNSAVSQEPVGTRANPLPLDEEFLKVWRATQKNTVIVSSGGKKPRKT